MIPQLEYMEKIARTNLALFLQQGHATAGHNGPHGHKDTPVRNTAHFLIIYSFLYKKYKNDDFAKVCHLFYKFLKEKQSESKSGAIQCMISDKFDHLNGLIGQGWVIEALIYYYEVFQNVEALNIAKALFDAQHYDWELHLWHRIELDGSDIGIDITSNHNVWFAGCSYKLAKYCNSPEIDAIIRDFLTKGQHVILNTCLNGLMVHTVKGNFSVAKQGRWKDWIKTILYPIRFVKPRKLDKHYIEYGYHIFDLYGYSILKKNYSDLPIFSSNDYSNSLSIASDIDKLLLLNNTSDSKKTNAFFYPYNSPSFEWPFVAKANGFYSETKMNKLWEIQCYLMYDESTGQMTKNNPDINTWNARTYEIIRFLEAQ